MYQPLAPCPGCRRHVRVEEPTCPFCTSALHGLVAPAPLPAMRLSRAALFVVASLGLGACTESTTPVTADPVQKAKPGPTASGKPVDDGGPDDPGAPQAEYGAPAPKPKPGLVDDGGPNDHGASKPKYGGPSAPPMPPPAVPAYGAPAPKLPPKAP